MNTMDVDAEHGGENHVSGVSFFHHHQPPPSDFQVMPFSLGDVSRVLSRDRVYGPSAHCIGASRALLRSEDTRQRVFECEQSGTKTERCRDEWGRDAVLKPTPRTLLFVRKDARHQGWDAVRSEIADDPHGRSLIAGPNRKKQLDDALTRVYERVVLKSQEGTTTHTDNGGCFSTRGAVFTRMFYSRAAHALEQYCYIRGWVYGRDLIVMSTGSGALDPMPAWCKARMPDAGNNTHGAWREQAFDVACVHTGEQYMRDLRKIILHVMYAVEDEMRKGGAASPWRLADENKAAVLEALREVVPEIEDCCLRAEDGPHGRSHGHSDTCTWTLHDNGMEGTLYKTADSLVLPRVSTVSEIHRRARRILNPEVPIYLACGLNGDTPWGELHGACLKMKYNVAVSLNTGENLNCAAEVMQVNLLGHESTLRRRILSTLSVGGCMASPQNTFLLMGTTLPEGGNWQYGHAVLVPSVEARWQAYADTLFSALSTGQRQGLGSTYSARIEPRVLRLQAIRMMWCSVVMHVRYLHWQRAQVSANNYVMDNANQDELAQDLRFTVSALGSMSAALMCEEAGGGRADPLPVSLFSSVPEVAQAEAQVPMVDVGGISMMSPALQSPFPFKAIWVATQNSCLGKDADLRAWIRGLVASAARDVESCLIQGGADGVRGSTPKL